MAAPTAAETPEEATVVPAVPQTRSVETVAAVSSTCGATQVGVKRTQAMSVVAVHWVK